MWKVRILGALLSLLSIYLIQCWWRFRGYYRIFEKSTGIKLPFICVVDYEKHSDAVYWGARRYRYITKAGRKDLRRSLNFRWTYPTTIYIQNFRIKIWSMDKARKLFSALEPYMDIPFDQMPFYGEIDGDMYEFFDGSKIRFVRYCFKLLQFFGWSVALSTYEGCNGLARYDGDMFAIYCIYCKRRVVVEDLAKLKPVSRESRMVVITSSTYSKAAKEYARIHHIWLIDNEHIHLTFLQNDVQFI